MAKVKAFIFISLNGYFKNEDGDVSWHNHEAEENQYAARSLAAGDILLFGRATYEMMSSYWPTTVAMVNDPIVAEGMNKTDKIVFSKTLKKAFWNNTRLIRDNIVTEIKKLKLTSEKDMTLLGSGSVFTQLAQECVIDEYQIMVDPIVLGSCSLLFTENYHLFKLKLISTKTFKSGAVLLCYKAV